MARLPAILGALALLVAPALGWQGRLLAPDGSPISGAVVSIAGHHAQARTGADGLFSIAGPSPPVTLLVELADGATLAVDLPALAGGGPTEIFIDPALHQEVDALARREIDLEASPGTVSRLIAAGTLVDRGETTIRAALETEPGTAPDTSDLDDVPALRGLSRGRTLVLLDGAPVVAERRAGVSAAGASPGTLVGIDLARGPNTILYGSSAMGGVLALRSPWADPDGAPRLESLLEIRGGDTPSRAASVSWAEDGWALAGSVRRTGDPTAADGSALAGEGRQESVFVGRSLRAGTSGLIRVGLRGDRLVDADRLAFADDPRRTRIPEDRLVRLTLRWDGPWHGAAASVVGWAGEQRRETLLPASSRTAGLDLSTTTTGRDAGLRATLTRDDAGRSLITGVDLSVRQGVDVRTRFGGDGSPLAAALDPEPLSGGRQIGAGLFAIAGLPLGEATTVHLGTRVERITSRAGTPDGVLRTARWVLSGSAAVTRRLGAHSSFALQVATGFREPLLTERFMTGLTGRGLVLARPALEPERSRHVDLTWRWSGRRMSVDASGFRTFIGDIVERDFLDGPEIPPEFAGLPVDIYRFVNSGRARLDGVEIAARIRLWSGGALRIAAHRLRGEDGPGVPLAGLPADAVRADLEAHVGTRWTLGAHVEFVARDRRPAEREVETPSFVIVHARAMHAISERWRAGLIVRNALDRRFPVGAQDTDPSAPGRAIALVLMHRR